MIFYENRLPADDSHEISCLICYFRKKAKFEIVASANYRLRFKDLNMIPPGVVVSFLYASI